MCKKMIPRQPNARLNAPMSLPMCLFVSHADVAACIIKNGHPLSKINSHNIHLSSSSRKKKKIVFHSKTGEMSPHSSSLTPAVLAYLVLIYEHISGRTLAHAAKDHCAHAWCSPFSALLYVGKRDSHCPPAGAPSSVDECDGLRCPAG